jgi:molybdopterin synthase sulfur carrier subunit
MLNIVFFASVKEQLGCTGTQLAWDDSLSTFLALEDRLSETHGPQWRDVLTQDNIIRAVNQTVVDPDVTLSDGDEVAFFPPVTGG